MYFPSKKERVCLIECRWFLCTCGTSRIWNVTAAWLQTSMVRLGLFARDTSNWRSKIQIFRFYVHRWYCMFPIFCKDLAPIITECVLNQFCSFFIQLNQNQRHIIDWQNFYELFGCMRLAVVYNIDFSSKCHQTYCMIRGLFLLTSANYQNDLSKNNFKNLIHI